MRLAAYDRLADVPAADWEGIAPPEFFFGRAFLDVMRQSRVEDAQYRYLVARDAAGPAALAVLTRFTLRLDLLSRDALTRVARRVRPRLLDLPIVCCGIPASYGQHHLHVVRPGQARAAVRLVHRFMEDWAAQERCSLLFWKEWHPDEPVRAAVLECGYEALPTLPDHRVPNLQRAASGFLGTLRSSYRRRYRVAAALVSGEGPVWQHGPLRLERAPFAIADAGAFHRGYSRVLERADVRLETYPPDFFVLLAESDVPSFTLTLTNTATAESITALMYTSGDVLTFGLIAKERAHYHTALYPVLLQCMVLYAVQAGFRELRLGQTSGYAKCAAGALPWRLETLIRARTSWQHGLLRRFGARLFPEVAPPRLSVYRAEAGT